MILLFFFCNASKRSNFLLLYVDDMIITGSDLQVISEFKQYLSQQFEMKDLGYLTHFLGLAVSSIDTKYYLSQAKYVIDLLSRANLTNSKFASTPLEVNVKFTLIDGKPLDDSTLYS